MRVLFLTLLLLSKTALCPGQTSAIITDRPDETESPYSVIPGSVQIETGATYERFRSTSLSMKTFSYNSTLIRVGINESLELRLMNEFKRELIQSSDLVSDHRGLSPTSAGLKMELSREIGWLPDIGFLAHLTFRSGTSSFMPSFIAPDFRFSFQHNPSDRFSVGYNIGGSWTDLNVRFVPLVTLSSSIVLSKSISCFAEIFGTAASAVELTGDMGVTYLLAPRVQVDICAGKGFSEESPYFFVTAGLSTRLFK